MTIEVLHYRWSIKQHRWEFQRRSFYDLKPSITQSIRARVKYLDDSSQSTAVGSSTAKIL